MKEVQLSEAAQRFLLQPLKPYYIREIKATIYARSEFEFEKKKEKLLKKTGVSSSFLCAFTGMPANYRIGVIKYKAKRIYKEVGAVVSEKVLEAIDKTQSACFATNFWTVVMDLEGNIIYRADYADIDKLSTKEGWRQFIVQKNSRH